MTHFVFNDIGRFVAFVFTFHVQADLLAVEILELKTWVGHYGKREGEANLNVYPAWLFTVVLEIIMIKPIKPNIGLWISLNMT